MKYYGKMWQYKTRKIDPVMKWNKETNREKSMKTAQEEKERKIRQRERKRERALLWSKIEEWNASYKSNSKSR